MVDERSQRQEGRGIATRIKVHCFGDGRTFDVESVNLAYRREDFDWEECRIVKEWPPTAGAPMFRWREQGDSLMDDVMTAQQVAEYLQCSPERVTQLARAGVLPGWRLGGSQFAHWRFRRVDVQAYIDRQVAPKTE